MEGGDILYIIIMGLVLLSGFFGKKKKTVQKEEAQPMPTFSGEVVKDFDDWFSGKDETIELETPEKPFQAPEKLVKTYENTKDVSALRIQKNNIEARTQQKQKKSEPLIISSENNTNTNLNIELSTAEDARKAFIYSEIFQRKY